MLQLERAKVNPILVPDESNWWESKAVFNCSVHNDGKTIHMLYRAIGEYEDARMLEEAANNRFYPDV